MKSFTNRIYAGFFALIVTLCALIAVSCNESSDDSDADGQDGDIPSDDDDDTADDDDDNDDDVVQASIRFAVLADPHIIDEFYEGPEGSELDTQTIFLTEERLIHARAAINAIEPAVELVFIAGDVAHNYPSYEWDWLMGHRTRFHIARELLDEFQMPVHIGFGNHDYDIPDLDRDFTHRLFKEIFGIDPYYYVDFHGIRFIHANNFLGATMDEESPGYNKEMGSFGREQLEWLDALLEEGLPTFIFLHFMVSLTKEDEFEDISFQKLLQKHKDTIRMVMAGHTHMWMDFDNQFGPEHWVISSTRYEPDAYAIFDVDTATGDYTVVNEDCIVWWNSETLPYDSANGCVAE